MTEIQTVILILEIGFAVMGLGFTALGTLILYLHSCTNKRIDKLDEKLTDMDRRICRVEAVMTTRECCMLSGSLTKQKAE